MNRARRLFTSYVLLLCVASVLVDCAVAQLPVQPTLPAGVDVDASGVLRMRMATDPTGQLTRQRMAEFKAALAPELARPSRLRKISLNRLEAALQKSLANSSGIPDEMRYLAGLTRLQYVFVYPETGDVVIAGPAEGYGWDLVGQPIGIVSGRSILELQDLVVALRCFPPGGAGTESIGCSIDPTPEGLQRMQQFLASIAGRVAPSDDVRIAAGLRESLGPQLVSIYGVPETTHFARVLVEADYRMKLIGIGLEVPPVKIVSYVQRANPSNVARNALQRWYFVPDYESVRVSEDALAIELVGQGVKLIGEQEYVEQTGARSQTRGQDRASQVFVHSFTERYAALAQKIPVYAQLRNLIDMSVVAAFLQEHDVYGQLNWKAALFNDESKLSVQTYPAPKKVESAVNVVWKHSVLMTPIGGGVTVEPKRALSSGNLSAEDDGQIAAQRQNIDMSSVDASHWWWD